MSNNNITDVCNLLYDIKEKITDLEYITLMNKMQDINNTNNNYKNDDNQNINSISFQFGNYYYQIKIDILKFIITFNLVFNINVVVISFYRYFANENM
jgi:hypothetical protein